MAAAGWELKALDEQILALVRSGLKTVKVPAWNDRVRKTECVLSFDSPESPNGLFVSLTTFQGFGNDYVDLDYSQNKNPLYLWIKWNKIPKPAAAKIDGVPEPTKLGIGIEGGFQVEDEPFEFEKTHFLAIMPSRVLIPLPNAELPDLIDLSVQAIFKASDLSESDAQIVAWEEKRQVSKYAENLPHLDNGKRVPADPSQWACEDCGVKENLWLNLSDGYIGSGRPQLDKEGKMSGGSGAALRHYQEMLKAGHKFPLVVKMGTITPAGADVYSYAEEEDDMVEDPKLKEHLARWGIDMERMNKTEKTMAELNIDFNIKFEFDKILEGGKTLKPLTGPGCVGLKNLGNSCYMNSVLQVLFSLPEVQSEYFDTAAATFAAAARAAAAEDLRAQMCKVGVGLLSDRYCGPEAVGLDGTTAVSPLMFKLLVGKGHAEFGTSRQQDAHEYIEHLLELLGKAEAAAGRPALRRLFAMETVQRLQCLQSGKVKYTTSGDWSLALNIPMEAAVNRDEVASYEDRRAKRQKSESTAAAAEDKDEKDREEPVKPRVMLQACLHRFAADGRLDDYRSPATGALGAATISTRIKTFPKYLLLKLERYQLSHDGTAKKLDVLVAAPDTLDLEFLRSPGPHPAPGEDPLPDDAPPAAAAAAAVADEGIVQQLVGMGFGANGCRRAALAVKNAGADAAMEWVFQHMEDPDFNDPIPPPGAPPPSASGAFVANPAAVEQLTGIGFTRAQATKALFESAGNVDQAGEWLMSRLDGLDALDLSIPQPPPAPSAPAAPGDGPGDGPQDHLPQYRLRAFISHMGSNTSCGHYVCHIRRPDGGWAVYNDAKVAVSEEPPLDMGYVYLYESAGPRA